MDTIEATKMVMSRIQNIDPENASKIMGYILIQDQGENEMIRLAFGPENLLASVIKQAKAFLDISSNTSSAPSSPSPFGHQRSPRIIIPNNGFHHMNPPPPLSPHSPWSSSGSFPDRRSSPRAASYASVVNGGGSSGSFYNNFGDVTEDYSSNSGLQVVTDQLSFLDNSKNVDFMDPIMSPGGRSDSILFPYPNSSTDWAADAGNCGDAHHHLHRRSCSVNDMFLGGGGGSDDVGSGLGGWRPCMYFARGFCKNGTSCKFAHGNGGFGDEMCLGSSSPTAVVGSPTGNIDKIEEFLRIKAIQQQQRIAAMAAGGAHPFPFSRCMNFLNESPRSPSAALMMGEDFHKFGRFRPDRHDLAAMGLGNSSSSSRQIYLTFPADSTFKEEDVSNYFSIFGPVQDVRIPYQQKRMFGFVTFVLPDTVKAILAKGNPHFVCDSRVLVKPYKEKGKIPDKKHQQQIERGDFSGCLSPSVLESAEPFDHIPFGARMFNHEMMLRRKLEGRAELQQAIDLQDRKLMNMQLTDLNNHQLHHNLAPVSSPTLCHAQTNQSLLLSSDGNNENVVSGDVNGSGTQGSTMDPITNASDLKMPLEVNDDDGNNSGNSSEKEENSNLSEIYNHESFEHILPDNLFASPTKTTATDHQSIFSMPEADGGVSAPSSSSDTTPVLPANSAALNMASLKSCYFQMPRSFCGQEAIEM
ncbi:zinc finger CCCH domain-containing protein 22-like isoform X1 [Cynara cardunculus var. scolymus]|uniref:zinc finger CCCH domain-containing protein 22-like isoform X1 n=1 Tax=Cynara cardunculus var. scolymus TaxID=59895 RepID=UPI000D62399A|nr:zinc finger CCCH domain-containing protein 22-like isoform X1 [Cynara cardunculus var. scolymus]